MARGSSSKQPQQPSTVAKKVPRPIVAPGPNPKGPPGWAEAQQERIADQNEAVSQGLPPVAGLDMHHNNGANAAASQDAATVQDQARAGLLPSQHQQHTSMFHGSHASGPAANGQPGTAQDASQAGQAPLDAQRQSQPAHQHPLATSTTAAGAGQEAGDTSVASTATGNTSTDYSTTTNDSTTSSPKSSKSKHNSPGRLSRTFHKLGEKLAIVPARNSENVQNASTMPELP